MLALNIPKLSGQCGKLICCLLYEDDAYTEAKKEFPRIGERLKINGVEYKITSFNVLSKVVKLDSENDVQFLPLQDVNKLLRKR
jgi:cell fate regulator YaaT (PSP1 superfamily)